MFRKCLVLLVALLWLSGCGGASPTSPSKATLQSAATSVTFAGKLLTLTSYPYRDFMASTAPSTSLRMILTIKTGDGSTMPSGLTVDAVWALTESTSWSAFALSPQPGFEPDYVVNASNGPSWDVGTSVTAVIRLKDAAGKTVLLRAPSQPIVSTF
jgi:hypothetical protein